MTELTNKILNKLREKINLQTESPENKNSFPLSSMEVAEALDKVKNSWNDIEADQKILERFIDEWIAVNL
ncbi:MAG: hypothetical protein IJ099_06305 [Alphaproteobacteria bacterium]|nr:hypothetical protein [Alphaproteobacteria bacterium]